MQKNGRSGGQGEGSEKKFLLVFRLGSSESGIWRRGRFLFVVERWNSDVVKPGVAVDEAVLPFLGHWK